MEKRIVKLTDIEWDVLSHRLEMPDTMAGTLTESTRWMRFEIEEAACVIYQHINASQHIHPALYRDAYDIEEELTQLILEDAVEGSTFLNVAEDAYSNNEITRQKLTAFEQAHDRVRDIIASLF